MYVQHLSTQEMLLASADKNDILQYAYNFIC